MHASADLAKGFKVIREYDPALYARMQASPWLVDTDVMVMKDEQMQLMIVLLGMDQDNFGITDNQPDYPDTLIVMPDIKEWARDNGVPYEWFLAAILAHEFDHVGEGQHRDNEDRAFQEEYRFVDLLPEPYRGVISKYVHEAGRVELRSMHRQWDENH